MTSVHVYHGQKDAELWVEIDHVAVGEDELRLAFLLAGENDGDLLSGDRQHRQLDTIELVETTPRTGLRQTCQSPSS